MSRKMFIKGTLILTLAGFCTRIIGFFYRIFLSHAIGAQGMGIYQLIMPLQMIALAVTASGIHTAISQLCAAKTALGRKKDALRLFLTGTFLSVFLAVLLAAFAWKHHVFLAVQILKEPRTAPLIRLLALSFPLSALHTCVNSYYFSKNHAGFPAFVQLLEQLVRVGSSYLVSCIFLSEGRALTPMIAVIGTLSGETAACLVSLFAMGLIFRDSGVSFRDFKNPRAEATPILKMALPISLNRLLLNLLSTGEVILIPQMLQRFGLAPADALSVYGIFTGMALPLILFPSAIFNSASVMLMPSVAKLQALGNENRLRTVTAAARRLCLGLGSLCTMGFLIFGEAMGTLLFKNPTAGVYIRALAFLCPFLYLNTTLTSILNGMGKTSTCLIHNLVCILLRICFVVLVIPVAGIRGYFYGLLCSQVLLSVLQLVTLKLLQRKNP